MAAGTCARLDKLEKLTSAKRAMGVAMLTRKSGYLTLRNEDDPDIAPSTRELQAEGFTLLPRVFSAAETDALAEEITAVFDELRPDVRSTGAADGHYETFRYEVLNRSGLAQQAIGHPAIFSVIEPLLGEDCHVIRADSSCPMRGLSARMPGWLVSPSRPLPCRRRQNNSEPIFVRS